MDGARCEFFAGARLAVDQDSAVGRRGDGDLLPQGADRYALADHCIVVVQLLAEPAVVGLELALVKRVAHREDGAFDLKRLFYEVERAEPRRAHRGLDVAVTADHYDRSLRIRSF